MSFTDNNNLRNVKQILNIIGSPFNESCHTDLDHYDLSVLYKVAQKNKIGLLFLESLSEKREINDELQDELNKQRKIHTIHKVTLERAASIMNHSKCKYAIVKSNYPFPATPNDVDLLIVGRKKEYKNAIEAMKSNQFELVGKEEPLEICLHDTTRAKHSYDQGKEFVSKDPFDVDIYKEIGAGHVIYMNKKELVNQISETTVNSTKVNILSSPAEVALSIFHAIYPERLYTLLLHFHILYVVKEMTSAHVEEFLDICREHKMQTAAVMLLSLAENIQELCFGETPDKLEDLREALGKNNQIKMDRMPYLIPMKILLKSFWGKRSDVVFTISMMRQIISMVNPTYAKYVIRVYKDRNTRDTY